MSTTTDMTPLSPTERTRVRRMPERSAAERQDLYDILDAGLVCHLGLVVDGAPMVLPTGYGRDGDTLYLHGSTGARTLMTAAGGTEVCVTVTHLDGIVLARSMFHHSMNYRSAVIYGTARPLVGEEEKVAGLRAISEQLAPGQWDTTRVPNRKELAATTILALSLAEASVKARKGPPSDEEADYEMDVWAGVLPIRLTFGEPVADPLLRPGIGVPEHVAGRRLPEGS